jgi:hypothetical protein
VGDTLARNAQQDAVVRQAMGAGGQTRQRGFRLPAGATGAAVQAFYDEKLRAAGWESGAGGPLGGMVGQMLGAMTPADSPVRTVMWARGKQTLTAVILTGPGRREGELILSLSTR